MNLELQFQWIDVIVDVQESEELFGDMNFNICGTEEGITAFQLVDVIQGGVHMDTLKLALTESMDPIKQQLNIINDALIKTEHQQKANVSFVRIPEEYFVSLQACRASKFCFLGISAGSRRYQYSKVGIGN